MYLVSTIRGNMRKLLGLPWQVDGVGILAIIAGAIMAVVIIALVSIIPARAELAANPAPSVVQIVK